MKKSKEQEKLLEQELETFRQEEKRKEKMVRRRTQEELGHESGQDLSPTEPSRIQRPWGLKSQERRGREGEKGK